MEAMKRINDEVDELIPKAIEDLKKPPTFLAEVQQSILRCHEIESKAFQDLSTIVSE